MVERLEEIDKFKSFIDSLDDSADADDFHKFIDTCQINYEEGTFNEILRFMKSQAERVQELEKDNKRLSDLNYHNNLPAMRSMHEEIERYKQALDGFIKEFEYEYGWQKRNVEGNPRSQWQRGALAGFEHVKRIYDKHVGEALEREG